MHDFVIGRHFHHHAYYADERLQLENVERRCIWDGTRLDRPSHHPSQDLGVLLERHAQLFRTTHSLSHREM